MTLLLIHLLFVGIWLGCVLTEALFERALLGKGREQELILTALHKKVDFIVEIPAFCIVFVTGVMLFGKSQPDTALYLKIGFALIALLANLYCVWLVLRRHAYAQAGNWDAFARCDHWQHKIGALVLLGILGALGVGLHRFAAS